MKHLFTAYANIEAWRKTARGVVLLTLMLLVNRTECVAQGTMQVTFNNQLPGAYTAPLISYTESGVNFAGAHGEGLALIGGSLSGYAENGTGYLLLTGGSGIKFGLTSGGYFNFISLDIAESVTNLPGPITFQVVGYHPMSATVTNTFTTDGINDGTGPLQDFQTFFLDSQFQNIYRVDILGSPFSLDNVVVSGVPEPTTASLALVGAGGAVAWSRFRRKNRHRQTHA